jgi:hypothetical protein
MGPLLSMAACPNCGAPHSVALDRRIVICIYCNMSLLVERAAASAAAPAGVTRLTAQPVSKEDIERIKQLLIDGRRDEAVAHYARVASVSPAEAEAAVDNVFISAYRTITRHLPINAYGFALFALMIFGGLGLAGWAATRAVESPAYFGLVAVGLLIGVTRFVRFLGHLRSTLVDSFGAVGRARILRRAVVREKQEADENFIVVLFEVTPEDGRPPFIDQETLFVGNDSLQKLAPGNVVRVRFDRPCTRVFPIRPVVVLATGP